MAKIHINKIIRNTFLHKYLHNKDLYSLSLYSGKKIIDFFLFSHVKILCLKRSNKSYAPWPGGGTGFLNLHSDVRIVSGVPEPPYYKEVFVFLSP